MEYYIQMGRIGLQLLVPWKASSFIKTEKNFNVGINILDFSPGPMVEILPFSLKMFMKNLKNVNKERKREGRKKKGEERKRM